MADGLIYQAIAEFQKQLTLHERAAFSEMVRVYGRGWQRIKRELTALLGEYQAALAAGEAISPNWIYRAERYVSLNHQIAKELARLEKITGTLITADQAWVINASAETARDMIILGAGRPPSGTELMLNRIDTRGIEIMVGMNQDSSPLSRLLRSISADGAKAASDALIEGIMLGKGARSIAGEVRDALGVQLTRAMTISRTEIIRAMRLSAEQVYMANQDVVPRWRWSATGDGLTCPSCLAMHGKEFPVGEPMRSHVNCRCAPLPVTASWDEIGQRYGFDFSGVKEKGPTFDELAAKYDMQPKQIAAIQRRSMTGEQIFRLMPAEQQRAVLGNAKWLAWKDGQFSFDDLSKQTFSVEWGEGKGVPSLKELIGADEAKRYADEWRSRNE